MGKKNGNELGKIVYEDKQVNKPIETIRLNARLWDWRIPNSMETDIAIEIQTKRNRADLHAIMN